MFSGTERLRAISPSQTELSMECLPSDLSLKIFCFLDHQDLATAQQVCRQWRVLASSNNLWCNLFKGRWGEHHAAFYAPHDSKLWKDVYQVQDRCDRVGLGLKIIRECDDYYLVHQGEIQRYLGSRKGEKVVSGRSNLKRSFVGEKSLATEEPCLGIIDKILFFIGDLEVASKRSRVL
ncbi:F-box/WD repeat-containing protein pof10-like [Telopea speciosissima]|uniref:F-box/WD repeat-containing protein pof10-like n=1 Tax=Telopea speciosissima TaxID=54955 RepID=UPI001CC539E7|nr:F-box/WD repeat-containing protein pof10-like [Telopea speciosissima]